MPWPLGLKKLRLEDDTVISAGIPADADNFTSFLLQNKKCVLCCKHSKQSMARHCQEGLSNLALERGRSASSVMLFTLEKPSANTAVWLMLADFFEGSNYKRIFLESQIYIHACV